MAYATRSVSKRAAQNKRFAEAFDEILKLGQQQEKERVAQACLAIVWAHEREAPQVVADIMAEIRDQVIGARGLKGRIISLIKNNPEMNAQEVADMAGCSLSYVHTLRKQQDMPLARRPGTAGRKKR